MPEPAGTPDPAPSTAAGPGPETAGGESGRDRLLGSLLRPSRAQLVVAALLALLGFAGITQVASNQTTNSYASLREQDLIEVLSGLTGAAERARQEVDRLEATRRDLESETNSREAALSAARERLQTLNILAGLVPVHGPGIRVTVTETEGRVKVSSLLDVVEELRTAGAEALEFNDSVRLAAQSSFDDSVGGIELDGVVLTSPYVIEVIGDPHTLATGLTFTSGPIEKLEDQDGAQVEVEKLDDVEIETVRDDVRPVHASQDPGE